MEETARIEAYLMHRMDQEEREAFERELDDNDLLRRELDWLRDVREVTRHQGKVAAKELLRQKELEINDSGNSFDWRKVWLAAASIAILLGTLWVLRGSAVTPQDLAAQYFLHFPNIAAPIDRGGEVQPHQEAFAAYSNHDYAVAASKFSALLQSDTLLLYQAVAALAMNQPEVALTYFSELEQLSPDFSVAAREWYTSLAHLANGDQERARKLLEEYIQIGHRFNRNKATALLEKLR